MSTQKPTSPAATATSVASAQTVRPRSNTSTVTGMMIGLGATVVFYIVAPLAAKLFAGGPEFVQRYFCGHPLEYVTSAMFFVGMGILAAKLVALPGERRAMRSIAELATKGGWAIRKSSSDEVVDSISGWQKQHHLPGLARTALARRLTEVLHYVRNREDGGGLEDHLRYLADLASDRLIQSYSLIRTVTWAVPIMGFLGTVVGITMAIANVTPEQLDSSLPEVTSGLAVAFDTTAQALGMSMILVFSTFLVERVEQNNLNEIEQFGIDHLVPSLTNEAAATQTTGIPALTDWTSQMLSQQTEFWNRHLMSLQTGWAESLAQQTDTLAQALNQETQQTLEVHRESINVSRDQYAATLHQSTQAFTQQMQNTMMAFVDRVDAWQNAMQTTTLSSAGQAEELHRLGRTLLQMTESEERLIQLQEQLNKNLQTLEMVATLEQTVNSLNAAVNVLTAKTALRVAA